MEPFREPCRTRSASACASHRAFALMLIPNAEAPRPSARRAPRVFRPGETTVTFPEAAVAFVWCGNQTFPFRAVSAYLSTTVQPVSGLTRSATRSCTDQLTTTVSKEPHSVTGPVTLLSQSGNSGSKETSQQQFSGVPDLVTSTLPPRSASRISESERARSRTSPPQGGWSRGSNRSTIVQARGDPPACCRPSAPAGRPPHKHGHESMAVAQ